MGRRGKREYKLAGWMVSRIASVWERSQNKDSLWCCQNWQQICYKTESGRQKQNNQKKLYNIYSKHKLNTPEWNASEEPPVVENVQKNWQEEDILRVGRWVVSSKDIDPVGYVIMMWWVNPRESFSRKNCCARLVYPKMIAVSFFLQSLRI